MSEDRVEFALTDYAGYQLRIRRPQGLEDPMIEVIGHSFYLHPSDRRALLQHLLEIEAAERVEVEEVDWFGGRNHYGINGHCRVSLGLDPGMVTPFVFASDQWTTEQAEDIFWCLAAALAEKRRRESGVRGE